jgi:hypothetical protein
MLADPAARPEVEAIEMRLAMTVSERATGRGNAVKEFDRLRPLAREFDHSHGFSNPGRCRCHCL